MEKVVGSVLAKLNPPLTTADVKSTHRVGARKGRDGDQQLKAPRDTQPDAL